MLFDPWGYNTYLEYHPDKMLAHSTITPPQDPLHRNSWWPVMDGQPAITKQLHALQIPTSVHIKPCFLIPQFNSLISLNLPTKLPEGFFVAHYSAL
jgi:hypothetical protein